MRGAIGVVQMERLPGQLRRRRELASQLKELVGDIEGGRPPSDPEWGGHIYQSFVVILDEGIDRKRVIEGLRDRDVETTIGTYALHDQPFYRNSYGYRRGQLPRSDDAFRRTLTLPLYPQMVEEDVRVVARELDAVIASTCEW